MRYCGGCGMPSTRTVRLCHPAWNRTVGSPRAADSGAIPARPGDEPRHTRQICGQSLRVARQVRYSPHNENAIDLVLFLNGIPVATCELKSDFTQSVDDAVDQYRFDREPRPKGQSAPEPLLSFPNGALVHFAVSNSAVMMTTQLVGRRRNSCPSTGATTRRRNPSNEKGGTGRPTSGKTYGSGIAGSRSSAATS